MQQDLEVSDIKEGLALARGRREDHHKSDPKNGRGWTISEEGDD